MCEPITATQAMLAISATSSALQFQQQKAQQKYQAQAQKRQNELAKQNALQRYASEQLKMRQVQRQTAQKGYEASLKARDTKSKFVTSAGERGVAMSGSINALMADYYRTEGQYKESLAYNYGINVSQYERTMEAIKFGAEAQSTYVQPPNPNLLFVNSALNVANTYYGFQADKEARGLGTKGYEQQSKRLTLNEQYPADYGTY